MVNRLEYGINVEKVEREDYYRRTLEKIRQGIAIEAQRQATRFDPYVYVLSIKRFVDLTTLQYLDKEQFCDVHQSQLKGREAVQQFLERHDTQKVAEETYLPGEGRFVEEDGLSKLNLWEPPPLRSQEGDFTILINHIRYLFSNDLDASEYFLDWVAHLVQHPAVKLKTTPLLIGAQGVGKDAIGLAIRQVLGMKNTVEIENEELKSQYNDWMRNTSLVVIGELMTRGRLEVMNRLKPNTVQWACQIKASGSG